MSFRNRPGITVEMEDGNQYPVVRLFYKPAFDPDTVLTVGQLSCGINVVLWEEEGSGELLGTGRWLNIPRIVYRKRCFIEVGDRVVMVEASR